MCVNILLIRKLRGLSYSEGKYRRICSFQICESFLSDHMLINYDYMLTTLLKGPQCNGSRTTLQHLVLYHRFIPIRPIQTWEQKTSKELDTNLSSPSSYSPGLEGCSFLYLHHNKSHPVSAALLRTLISQKNDLINGSQRKSPSKRAHIYTVLHSAHTDI